MGGWISELLGFVLSPHYFTPGLWLITCRNWVFSLAGIADYHRLYTEIGFYPLFMPGLVGDFVW